MKNGCDDLSLTNIILPRMCMTFVSLAIALNGARCVSLWFFAFLKHESKLKEKNWVSDQDYHSAISICRDNLIRSGHFDDCSSPQQHNKQCRKLLGLTGGTTAMRYILGHLAIWLFSVAIVMSLELAATQQSLFTAYNSLPTTGNITTRPATSAPIMAFSFTTTSRRIHYIKPVLDALLHATVQPPYDKIYVTIPLTYKGERTSIPPWLADKKTEGLIALRQATFTGMTGMKNSSSSASTFFAVVSSKYHYKVHLVLLKNDLGPGSKLLGALLAINNPETIIIYGDDDLAYPSSLTNRVLYYMTKHPNTAFGVVGGWIGKENSLYCGRSLEIGVNSVSFLGGVGGVAVRRGFFDRNVEELVTWIQLLPKSCFLGDDLLLSHILSMRNISRRLVYDTCWNYDAITSVPNHARTESLSGKSSKHAGGFNVQNYQSCMSSHLADKVSYDAEFGYSASSFLAKVWGLWRTISQIVRGGPGVPC